MSERQSGKFLSYQQLFDKVCKHLIDQGEPSLSPEYACSYRGQNGLKCSVGVLIQDEHYNEELEGMAVLPDCAVPWSYRRDKYDTLMKSLLDSGIDTNSPGVRTLLRRLQAVHDDHYMVPKDALMGRWKMQLRAVAKSRDLTIPECIMA